MSLAIPHPQLQLAAFAISAVSFYFAVTPPVPIPNGRDRVYSENTFDKVVRQICVACKVFVISLLVCDAMVTAAATYPRFMPPYVAATVCPTRGPDFADARLRPEFAIGAFLLVFGGVIRVRCYRALGDLFTFEVTLRPSHTLVTSGPYRYVRHPGYTAIFMCVGGYVMILFSRGGWVRQCSIMQTPLGLFIAFFLLIGTFAVVSLWKRGRVEDAGMKERFGDSWYDYRRSVPFSFIPGIY
ncbi:hypothetical protein FA95DRAFT_1559644 [Auriscalpium vulgare]|uniref:Uncharacterized protein n=1 Tax=Auriscalpium vulgare TaxID=40419 RepID=A0ACB8RS79_9AGAM|nr:hypothetical protein FA95DRAFT_1559644 [Auriscalpium vulgare]